VFLCFLFLSKAPQADHLQAPLSNSPLCLRPFGVSPRFYLTPLCACVRCFLFETPTDYLQAALSNSPLYLRPFLLLLGAQAQERVRVNPITSG